MPIVARCEFCSKVGWLCGTVAILDPCAVSRCGMVQFFVHAVGSGRLCHLEKIGVIISTAQVLTDELDESCVPGSAPIEPG